MLSLRTLLPHFITSPPKCVHATLHQNLCLCKQMNTYMKHVHIYARMLTHSAFTASVVWGRGRQPQFFWLDMVVCPEIKHNIIASRQDYWALFDPTWPEALQYYCLSHFSVACSSLQWHLTTLLRQYFLTLCAIPWRSSPQQAACWPLPPSHPCPALRSLGVQSVACASVIYSIYLFTVCTHIIISC